MLSFQILDIQRKKQVSLSLLSKTGCEKYYSRFTYKDNVTLMVENKYHILTLTSGTLSGPFYTSAQNAAFEMPQKTRANADRTFK
jgi:hypothetical protein